ncbi:hypothetical protein MLD38_023433 [Melastoma candidum]|uniref:Uncharacterized protein n=1 Tax=Melastoma candidum TaxID=119954 RepID=A0ACB9NPQ7_9MYRT|nr:hypothetical protein MLD38_023433 [Melastoma candidum]
MVPWSSVFLLFWPFIKREAHPAQNQRERICKITRNGSHRSPSLAVKPSIPSPSPPPVPTTPSPSSASFPIPPSPNKSACLPPSISRITSVSAGTPPPLTLTPLPSPSPRRTRSSPSSSPPLLQSQHSESLSLIGKHDFPKLWPSLLPSYKTDDLLRDVNACPDAFARPLLDIFLQTARLIEEVSKGSNLGLDLRSLFESQRLCCRIFYSLNFQLSEFFEDHMDEWMGEFEKYLTSRYPTVEDGGNPPMGAAVIDELRATVCENISLYMEKNEEEY